ncbi:T9SS type A sorting domain-containing protein [Flavobacterium piscinae]|uniref:T9SS type A sorting domain-containing protein n=1 Tax=Flavobacterium piscinae TaxID=2506424 RepID=UPI001993F536|nr:T9SS type A sorting domain-containing protein [Flavobacterium piscinae]MBC8882694.1 T9SS type A sorting domain-containing protein [Flavobacterium piscinae]
MMVLLFATFGDSPLTWVSNHTGVIRFYSHLNDQCETEEVDRERSFICGVLTSDVPEFANLQFPFDATIEQGETVTVYGQIYVAGLTDVEPNIVGQAPGIQAWVGVSPIGENTNPNTWTTWIPATWNDGHVSNNDEYQANIGTGLVPGTYYYATRYRLNDGPYVYGGTNNGFWDGTTYLSGVLTVTPPPAPGNDECANATPLTPGAVFEDNSLTSSNAAATANVDNPVPTCGAFNFATNGKDVWFSVVVPESGTLTIETQGNGGLSDSVLEVYSGSCEALVLVDCNDDVDFPANPYSRLELDGLTAGQTLLVRVWGYNGAEGSFVVSAFDASLSTGSFDNAGFKYYPNPVKDVLNLSYISSISNVSVINLLGQQVFAKNVNANESQLDLSSLTAGTYLVKVTTEDNLEKTIKIVKQ